MRRVLTGRNAAEEGLHRLRKVYRQGHRVVVGFSGGKDSTVCLELAIIAARAENRLPVDVSMRDDEIMFPGTFEYAERVAVRPEVKFHWIVARQPFINIFNREMPYVWAFDPQLPPEKWMRQFPAYAMHIPEMNIQAITAAKYFPAEEGKDTLAVIGLRIQESMNRRLSAATGGILTGKNSWGTRSFRPILEWSDTDVWKLIRDLKADYNTAYDVLARNGLPNTLLRIAPPTQSAAGAKAAAISRAAWPRWFDQVSERCPGFRSLAHFGPRCVDPIRRNRETWEDTFRRVCLDEAPQWIKERAQIAMENTLRRHALHSSSPFNQIGSCGSCHPGSWASLTRAIYMGDPFSMKVHELPYVEPEFFRPGGGTWNGKPTF